jgi:hypothetical protein
MNSTRSFLVAPDGSKEGWEESDKGDQRREEFVEWLRGQAYNDGSNPLAWIELYFAAEQQFMDDFPGAEIVRGSHEMTAPLKCIECGVELTTTDAEEAVKTDAGLCHRECFQGPVPPPDIADDILADLREDELIDADEEEAARRDHGDVPLPALQVGRYGSLFSYTPEEGWTVNGEPYNPNEDGVHQPLVGSEAIITTVGNTTTVYSNADPYLHPSGDLYYKAEPIGQQQGISIVNGIICADDRSRRQLERMEREDLDTPLDPDRRD